MKLEGYYGADTNDFIPTADIPDIYDIVVTTTTLDDVDGFEKFLKYRNYWGVSIVFALIAISIRKGIKKNF